MLPRAASSSSLSCTRSPEGVVNGAGGGDDSFSLPLIFLYYYEYTSTCMMNHTTVTAGHEIEGRRDAAGRESEWPSWHRECLSLYSDCLTGTTVLIMSAFELRFHYGFCSSAMFVESTDKVVLSYLQ